MSTLVFVNKIPHKIINKLENYTSLSNAILVFFFSISLRTLAETFSQENVNYLNLPFYLFKIDLVHFALSYSVIAMIIMILFHYATQENLKKIALVVLPFFILLLISPLVDIILTNGKGHDLKYFLPETHPNLIKNFFTYCSFYDGISVGLRIEILVYICGFYCYFREKGKNIISSLMYSILGYAAIFIWGCSPIIIKSIVNMFGFEYDFSGILMINFFAILVFLLGSLLFFLHYRPRKIKLYKSSILFSAFLIMQIIGLYLGLRTSGEDVLSLLHQNGDIIIFSILFFISLLCFSIFINNMSNKIEPMFMLALPCVLSLLYADLINVKIFFIMFSAMGLCYLQFYPPFLLNRTSFASFIIYPSVYTLISMSSYLIVRNEVTSFPKKIFFYIVLGMLFFRFFKKLNFWNFNDNKTKKITVISS